MAMKNSAGDVGEQVSRPIVQYHPNVWEKEISRFSNTHQSMSQQQTKNADDEEDHEQEIQALVETIRNELMLATKSTIQKLEFIDTIQRLGLAYHFELEIAQSLKPLCEAYDTHHLAHDEDIYSASLRFRLLRQNGYRGPCNVLDKFKGDDGKLNDTVRSSDVGGMLELYEASFLNVHGEDVLETGRAFTRSHLTTLLHSSNLDNTTHVEKLVRALEQPYWRGLTRLQARGYIPIYEKDTCCNKTLLRLAKLDFNRVQSLHKKELAQVCRWWKRLDVQNNFPFARNRIVECYFWAVGAYFEPKYALGRNILGRVIALLSIMDDIYDAYATYEELQVFTEAIERWNLECLNGLPTECLKIYYKELVEVYEEIEQEMAKEGTLYRMDYAKESIKISARAFLEEARWRKHGYTPTMKEYMDVSTKSCSYLTLIITSYLGMGDVVSKDHFQWAIENPLIIRAACMLCRLQDDVVGYEFEKKSEHVATSVDCYMNENNVTKDEAINELKKQIEAVRKDINEGFLASTEIPAPLRHCAVNFGRVIEVVYKDDDWYTHVGPEMQSYIRQVLFDPIVE